jgi:hypothetical protein
MPQWEYTTVDLSKLSPRTSEIDLLNDAGEQGWELVTIVINGVAYLKRQVMVATTPSVVRSPRHKTTTDAG